MTHDLICDHDLRGVVLSVNAAAANALQMDVEELRGRNIRDLLSDEVRPRFDDYLETIRRNGVAEGLMSVRTRMGEKRVWHYHNALFGDGIEEPIVRGVASDVTEREKALRALSESERHFRSIIENASDIIGIIDLEGRIQYHSPSAERSLGYTNEELTGRRLADFVHDEDLHRTNEFFEEQTDPLAPARTIDLRMRHRDGSWRWLSVVASTVVRGGVTRSIIINGRDVTDRLLLEAQLAQANRVNGLGRLAATVAHEFNNVLMGIQPFADLIQRPGVSPEMINKAALYITNSVARGKRVALDILRFTNPAEPTLRPLAVDSWWERLAGEMHVTLANGIEFTWDVAPSLTVMADAAQLAQVFATQIANARDAMPSGGRLHVSARPAAANDTYAFGLVVNPERFVHFAVGDTGCGMPENILQHCFDPLFTTKRNGGTGLGLAVSHQAVQRHGGHIFAESAVGGGTTFHVFIPAAVEAVMEMEEARHAEPERLARRVLIVDDELTIGEGIAELLREEGMRVEVAIDGRSAISASRRFHPDLALIDIGLPDFDGVRVAQRLRVAWPQLKVIFVSGHAHAAAAPSCDADTSFLQKPFEVGALLAAMKSLEVRAPS